MMDMLVPGRVPTSSAKQKPFGEAFDGEDFLRKKHSRKFHRLTVHPKFLLPHLSQEKKTSYFPLNPGCLIRILISWFMI